MSKRRLPYKVVYRKVKHPRIKITPQEIIVIAPSDEVAKMVYEKYKKKIDDRQKHIKSVEDEIARLSKQVSINPMSMTEFREYVLSKIEEYAPIVGNRPNKVLFRLMRTRWGSNSSKGNITINTLARYLPKHLIDYIVFHEMLHFVYRNHNKAFWRVIDELFGDHEKIHKKLSSYLYAIQERK
ncbi:M48 metallopeptidase family protein [Zhurongbacter thermophilus]